MFVQNTDFPFHANRIEYELLGTAPASKLLVSFWERFFIHIYIKNDILITIKIPIPTFKKIIISGGWGFGIPKLGV